MNILDIIFYVLAAVILIATGLALSRRNMVHAVLYLVITFIAGAMLFYLLGAPFLAALEVIIYPGAIMVLFLFIIMMIDIEHAPERRPGFRRWAPVAGVGAVSVLVGGLLLTRDASPDSRLTHTMVSPADFGRYLIERHWLLVEVISIMLLVALVGALYLGGLNLRTHVRDTEEGPK